MGQQRKRPAAGMQSNHSKQSKQPRKSEKDVTVTQEETVDSLPNDLFENLDEEMNVDTTEDIHYQTNFSDNETWAMTTKWRKKRDFYMAQLTQAFPNDLDKLREEENFDHHKLEILIDSLEAGVDIFSDIEKSFAVMSS
ncbi:unnamed protein product [Umbelopsis vinacea]